MAPTKNPYVLEWIEDCVDLCQPEQVIWIDGTRYQANRLGEQATNSGELLILNQDKLPGCMYRRSAINDVARVEGRTFICCEKQEDAGPTNNWMDPNEMKIKLRRLYDGCMKGRTMYIIPYSMGLVGSPFAKYGFEITDSIYVVISMEIMTRTGNAVLEALGEESTDFVRGLHSKGTLSEEDRYIAHFPEEDYIMSVNSDYGGNALLGKKCFALRIASKLGRDEGWLAEHMMILGIENPQGEVSYVCGAFPSACGKTNLAMLIPPDAYREKGWKCWTVGDDIAWLRPGPDGRLWAINPEAGFFGVAPGTSLKSNENAMRCTEHDAIFTNVAITEDGTVWWEGIDKNPPPHGLWDWRGNRYNPESGLRAAHLNSRFTCPAENCPSLSPEFHNPQGVPISAIIFGGRRAKTTPLVYQSRSWAHGVFVGSTMGSEKTAASEGKLGELRHDPMAMLPFCGYHMADYWQHWLDMEKLLTNPPKIFNVNWFRTDDEGNFLWPGYRENLRALEWIMKRCRGLIDAEDSVIGWLPRPEDIDMTGLDEVTPETLRELLSVDPELWRLEAAEARRYYKQFGDKVPRELYECLDELEARLAE